MTPPGPLIATAAAGPPEIDEQALNDALDRAFEKNEPLSPKCTRAVVVVQNGWVIAERYAQGIQHDVPLIGWSMSKSITHALIGRGIQEGLLDPEATQGARMESSAVSTPRDQPGSAKRMNSGLAFEESTGILNSDLVRMLTQEAEMAGFAASQTLSKKPGTKWSYSSGTTKILSRILRHAIDDDQRYWSFPKKANGAHWWFSRHKSRPDLPSDSFSAEGYQGQLLLVAPSQRAVVVRLGQTPKKPGFDANAFGADVF